MKWGSSQRWALGYEVTLKGVCLCVCECKSVCLCVTYISDICQIHWHICWCEWHWACRPAPSIPSPLYSLWHGTVLHLVCGVMRQTDETVGGFKVQSGLKLTGVFNYSTWSDNMKITVYQVYVFYKSNDFRMIFFLNKRGKKILIPSFLCHSYSSYADS